MSRLEQSDSPVWREVFDRLTTAREAYERVALLPGTDPARLEAERVLRAAEEAFHRLEPEFTAHDDA